MMATPRLRSSWISLICHAGLGIAVMVTVAAILCEALATEAYHIPSGSMAPALRGHHRKCACPRCGQEIVVGRAADDRYATGDARYYRNAFCPNCGLSPIPIADVRESRGDQVLVNRMAYRLRSPSRWEIVVFRLFGTFYIKRILGLPGEVIEIRDGDLYVNGSLCRKSFVEARRMRILMFDQAKVPQNIGWRDRWEARGSVSADGAMVSLDGRRSAAMLTYRNFLLDERKCEPIRDEYAHNAGLRGDSECVHDFWVETEIEVSAGSGTLALRLCDGHDWVDVTLPIGTREKITTSASTVKSSSAVRTLERSERRVTLEPSRRYLVEVAFVDRRLSVAIDGEVLLSADLPEAKNSAGVARPFQVHADGVAATLHGLRLYRDVHYSQHGKNAVRGASVRLGSDQYFMLGDNSPQSEDSRFWPDDGCVPFSELIGPVTSVRGK